MSNQHLSKDEVPPEVYRRLIWLLVKKTASAGEAGGRPVSGKTGKKKKAAR